jgi:hypothetical protein
VGHPAAEETQLPDRSRAPHSFAIVGALTLAFALLLPAPTLGASAPPKVVIIVGPTGPQTDSYRSSADQIAATASAAGANVTKVYSPNATWANVRAAVNGANIIVYLGHGNGFPSPYSSTEDPTKVNGWGLNRTTTNGDADDWRSTLVYCGENALLGTLPSSLKGWTGGQWEYCGGANGTQGITPAPGFVMIYQGACYAPGAGETGGATEQQAHDRVVNYSYPALALGAGAYFANDFGASSLIDQILRYPDRPFGEIYRAGTGYDAAAQRRFTHRDVPGAEVRIQKTYSSALGRSDYWYAFAGNPARTPAGGQVDLPPAPRIVSVAPPDGRTGVRTSARPRADFDVAVQGVSGTTFSLYDSFGFHVPAAVRWRADLNRAILVPSRRLVIREWYTARLGGGITSPEGTALAPYQWRFRTKDDGGDGVSVRWGTAKQLVFRQGTHTGYKFDSEGRLTASKTGTLAWNSGAKTITRRTLPNQSGYWFYVTNGMWGGFWLRQSDALYLADDVAPLSDVAAATYDPSVRLIVKKGTHTGYKFDAAGAMTARKISTLAWDSGANTSALQAVPNQAGGWFRVVNGIWAGYWLRASDVVVLRDG